MCRARRPRRGERGRKPRSTRPSNERETSHVSIGPGLLCKMPRDRTYVLALPRRFAEGERGEAAKEGCDNEPGDPEEGQKCPVLGATDPVVAKIDRPWAAAVREEVAGVVGRRGSGSCSRTRTSVGKGCAILRRARNAPSQKIQRTPMFASTKRVWRRTKSGRRMARTSLCSDRQRSGRQL